MRNSSYDGSNLCLAVNTNKYYKKSKIVKTMLIDKNVNKQTANQGNITALTSKFKSKKTDLLNLTGQKSKKNEDKYLKILAASSGSEVGEGSHLENKCICMRYERELAAQLTSFAKRTHRVH